MFHMPLRNYWWWKDPSPLMIQRRKLIIVCKWEEKIIIFGSWHAKDLIQMTDTRTDIYYQVAFI